MSTGALASAPVSMRVSPTPSMTRQVRRGFGRCRAEALALLLGAALPEAAGALADADAEAPGSGPRLGSHMPQRVSEAESSSRGRTRRLGIEHSFTPKTV